MLEKPDLADERILSCLRADFDLPVTEVAFLPLGADVNTAVYRAVDASGAASFVKLRRGPFDELTVAIPRFLRDQGISQLIAPRPTRSGRTWTRLDDYTVTLYPFVAGRNGFEQALSERQWHELGAVLRAMHAVEPPPALRRQLPREVYAPRWREAVQAYQRRADKETFPEPIAAQLAAFLRAERETISRIVERAEQLAAELRRRALPEILCHGDIHAFNVLLPDEHQLFIVDWDTLVLAPRERDLMFIGGGIGSVWNSAAESDAFYRGYGPVAVDPEALAYYRYERIVEDIAAFCEQLLDSDAGAEDREQALRFVVGSFGPNEVVEIALRTDPEAGT